MRQYSPSKNKAWLAFHPDDGPEFFATEAEAVSRAKEFIDDHQDGELWSDEVARVSVGKITMLATQVNLVDRPDDSELDEDGCDADGDTWPDGIDYRCGYELQPVSEVSA